MKLTMTVPTLIGVEKYTYAAIQVKIWWIINTHALLSKLDVLHEILTAVSISYAYRKTLQQSPTVR